MADDWDSPDFVMSDAIVTTAFGEIIEKKLNEKEEEKKAAEAAEAAALAAANQLKQAKEKIKKQQQKAKDVSDGGAALEAKALTPQELENLQRASDLAAAAEIFGTSESTSSESIDRLEPRTKEDFDKLVKLLSAKLTQFQKNEFYSGFLDALFTDLCIKLDPDQIRHYSKTLSALGEQRHKELKEKEKAKQPKSKKKPTLHPSKGGGELDDIVEGGGYNDYNDDDDFM